MARVRGRVAVSAMSHFSFRIKVVSTWKRLPFYHAEDNVWEETQPILLVLASSLVALLQSRD